MWKTDKVMQDLSAVPAEKYIIYSDFFAVSAEIKKGSRRDTWNISQRVKNILRSFDQLRCCILLCGLCWK
jgi:hypothetical protein